MAILDLATERRIAVGLVVLVEAEPHAVMYAVEAFDE
jgi:hypothetical protein